MGNMKEVTKAIKPIHSFAQTLTPSNPYNTINLPYSQDQMVQGPSDDFSFIGGDTDTLQPMSQGTYFRPQSAHTNTTLARNVKRYKRQRRNKSN